MSIRLIRLPQDEPNLTKVVHVEAHRRERLPLSLLLGITGRNNPRPFAYQKSSEKFVASQRREALGKSKFSHVVLNKVIVNRQTYQIDG